MAKNQDSLKHQFDNLDSKNPPQSYDRLVFLIIKTTKKISTIKTLSSSREFLWFWAAKTFQWPSKGGKENQLSTPL